MIGAGPWLTWFVNARQFRFRQATTSLALLAMVGGIRWATMRSITIGLESLALYLVTQLLARIWPAAGQSGWAGSLALVTLVWVLCWPDAVPFDPQLSSSPGFRLIIAGTIMTLMSIVLQFVPPRQRQPTA